MNIKNSLKIAANEYNLIFKILLFDFIAYFVIFSIAAAFIAPDAVELANEINDVQIFERIKTVIDSILAGGSTEEAGRAVTEGFDRILEIFDENSWLLTKTYIIMAVVYLFLRFLLNLRSIPVADILNSRMSSNTKFGFTSNLISNIGKSTKFSLALVVVQLPVDILIFTVLYLFIGPLFGVFGIFALPLCFILVICLVAFKDTLTFCWIPSIVVDNKKIWSSFAESIKSGFKNFGTLYGLILVLRVVGFAMFAMVTLFTFGAGALIALPLILIIQRTIELVFYYDKRKLRYYSDAGKDIVTPDGAEVEEISDVKENKIG